MRADLRDIGYDLDHARDGVLVTALSPPTVAGRVGSEASRNSGSRDQNPPAGDVREPSRDKPGRNVNTQGGAMLPDWNRER